MDTFVRDLKPGMKNLQMTVIVLEIGKPSTTKENHVIRTARLADGTGSVNLSVWNEPGDYLRPGDICRLNRVYTAVFKGCLTLYTGKVGEIIKVGEFCMPFSELPFISEFNPQFTNEGVKAAQAKSASQQFPGPGNPSQPGFRPDAQGNSLAPNGRPLQPAQRPHGNRPPGSVPPRPLHRPTQPARPPPHKR